MKFVETPVFTRRLLNLLSDEEYRSLQMTLLLRPHQGSLIPESGGLRKLRWRLKGKGKRGGLRVIYYWDRLEQMIYMLLVYPKNEQEDLTANQLKVLSKLVEKEFK